MTSEGTATLLSADDPSPVHIANPAGTSLFLLLGDHAGNRVPSRLARLGLKEADLQRHIALDIGVSQLGRTLAARLDATFIEQRYSRLVVDCNRSKASPGSIAPVSDGTAIGANATLDDRAKERRYREVFDPYHAAIADVLDARAAAGTRVVLVSLHSFTPELASEARPWDIGILFDGGDTGFARALLGELRAKGAWSLGDNEPYRMDDTDYTVPAHAYTRSLPYAEIEVRQDHLVTEAGAAAMAAALAEALTKLATDFA